MDTDAKIVDFLAAGPYAVVGASSAREKYGNKVLLSGAAPRVVKRTLQTALLWTLYEELFPALSRVGEAVAARMQRGKSSGGGDAGSSGTKAA